jgi:hypothetical protein
MSTEANDVHFNPSCYLEESLETVTAAFLLSFEYQADTTRYGQTRQSHWPGGGLAQQQHTA